MGCMESKSKRVEKYRATHQDEITKKRSMERMSREGSARKSKEYDAVVPKEAPKAKEAPAAAKEAPKGSGQIAQYKPARPKLDPKDFQFVDLKGQVAVKAPGSINGQAFAINNVEDCDLYVVDACAQVMIDKARNCRIFIGPTEGSVFIRNCVNCKFAVICRQLRTRDCQNIDMALFCRTRPVVEASVNMAFACYDLNYEALPGQLKTAKLEVLTNFWSHIYDFTPKPGNWRLLPADTTVETLLGPALPQEAAAALGKHGKEGPLLVTWGDRTPTPSPDYLFVIFTEKKADAAMQFANQAKHQAVILRANKTSLNPEQASRMTQISGWTRSVERDLCAGSGVCIGFEVSGAGCATALHGVAHALGGVHTENEEAGAMFRYAGIEN